LKWIAIIRHKAWVQRQPSRNGQKSTAGPHRVDLKAQWQYREIVLGDRSRAACRLFSFTCELL
jgi:hypothetical protein